MKRSIELFMVVVTALVLWGLAKAAPAQEVRKPNVTPADISSTPGTLLLPASNQPQETDARQGPTQEVGPASGPASHVSSVPGTLFIPKSSLAQAIPAGHKFAAQTNVQVFIPSGLSPDEAPPIPGYGYETPESLTCHYGLAAYVTGCPPQSTTYVEIGGSKTIAIVDAYDDPDAPGDLAWFSAQFGLPLLGPSKFQVVWANDALSSCPVNLNQGVPSDATGGWELEEATDIEWAHALAPNAAIYLVEACSNLDSDLQRAVLVANNLVSCGASGINSTTGVLTVCTTGTGQGEVSMGWGSPEFVGENASNACATLDDSCFTTPGVVYFAAAGDSPGVLWPGTSPNVVSAGGTTMERNPSTFAFEREAAWVFTGDGQSSIEAIPSYQSTYISSICATYRCVPDLSFDSDPYTGVYVYDTFPVEGFSYYEWAIVGGTSVAAPSLAGIVNNAASRTGGVWAASSNAELTTIYTNQAVTNDFTDIKYGFCGPYMGFETLTGWDFCTGVGVDKGYTGK